MHKGTISLDNDLMNLAIDFSEVDHLSQHHFLNDSAYFIFNKGKKHYSKQ